MKLLQFLAVSFFVAMLVVMLLQLRPDLMPNRAGERGAIGFNKWFNSKRNNALRDATLIDRDTRELRNR